MKISYLLSLGFALIGLSSCFDKKNVEEPISRGKIIKKVLPQSVSNKDKSLETLIRYFSEADAVHREAWWVLNAYRSPVGKSPFGKVQRALLSSQNIKLTNKSLFRCDRYQVKSNVLGVRSYPQKIEVFEKCSEKTAARLIASLDLPNEGQVNVVFYPSEMQDIVGLAASILNKQIHCKLQGKDHLELLSCKDWAQDRTQDRTQGQMIVLDTYEYNRVGGNTLRLKGKVMENLSEIRKIEAVVPLDGKISVIETEMYAPEAPVVEKKSPPVISPVPAVKPRGAMIKSPAPAVDPDVIMQNQMIHHEGQDGDFEGYSQDPTLEGFPSEGSEELQDPNMGSEDGDQQELQQQEELQSEQPQAEGVPNGR